MEKGPWDREPAKPPPPPTAARNRLWIGLGIAIAVAAGLALLAKGFPGAVRSGQDKASIGYNLAWIALLAAGLFTAGRIDWLQKARHLAVWAAIVGVLVVGVSYRAELEGVVQRVRTEFSASYPVATGAHELVVAQNGDGGFYVMGEVNGRKVQFLVDTGATDTVLSPDDAKRLGIDTSALKFDQRAQTANGVGYGAKITADSLAIGPIRFDQMPMMVNKAPMGGSLLGMTFLKRLESFQVRERRMYLRARG